MNRLKIWRGAAALLLAALLLAGCGAAPVQSVPDPGTGPDVSVPDAPVHQEGAVVVTNIDALLAALAPDTTIEIDAAHLRLDDAADYGFGYSEGPYTWESLGDGQYELVLRGLHGLTLRGMKETRLTTKAPYANVLSCRDCGELTLEGLTLGHRGEALGCSGNVLDLRGCDDVLLKRCELFGCGVIAVNAYECTRLYLEDSTLRDCTMAALNVTACTDFQARGCEILRCGKDSPLAALCVAGSEGFALINCTVRDGQNTALLDAMNSTSVYLLGGEASSNRFSNALFLLYDHDITISGCAVADNEFGACYYGGAQVAETAAGKELLTFRDFAGIERRDYDGEYVGPVPRPAATPAPISEPQNPIEPVAVPAPGETQEIHVTTVDELLAAIAPRTTIYLDGEEFNVSSASDYAGAVGPYYGWSKEYDGYTLVLKDLEDFAIIGGGMGSTLISAEPRYADVLRFEGCRRVLLSDVTLGHTIEPGFCSGDVLDISWSEDVTVERCGFFGCGEIGITASCASKLRVVDSNIYECSYLGAYLDRVSDMTFSGCSITDCGDGGFGFNGIRLDDCSGVFYNDQRLYNGNIDFGAAG